VLLSVLAALVGLGAGAAVNRAAGAFPWTPREADDGAGGVGLLLRSRTRAVPLPFVELGTAALFALTALHLGWSAELPAFLVLAGAAVLLTVVDLQHRLLPNRVVVPTLAAGAVLLTGAAVAEQAWEALLRAGLGAVVLFVSFFVLALISPRSLGMGDVKLAAVLGLYLGWLGWDVLVLGAAAGFVVQAVVALVLLAARRIGLRGELPFGPAMLLGTALAIAAGHILNSV
jgi:leader peptidase (prepilin peptidase)/N-methyltransferase